MTDINWAWVGKAVQHYIGNGFSYLEAPWVVSQDALQVTLPSDRFGFRLNHPNLDLGYLVGSAEQSFIQMMMSGLLDKGKYCAAGPCFRDETIVDNWHQYYFFKIELIEVSPESSNLFEMLHCARDFMEKLGAIDLDIAKTEEGFDLYCNDIEVGSYGYREYKGMKWIYGTGLALPRFTNAITSLGNLV